MSSSIDRNNLRFQDAVRKHFAFLEAQYAFKCFYSDLYIVKYNSDRIYLNVYHEKISYELYFEIGMLPEEYDNPLKAYTRDIVAMFGTMNGACFFQASNTVDVNAVVRNLANLVRVYAEDALLGSAEYFYAVIDHIRKVQKDAITLQKLKALEEKANRAWVSKDYRALVDACNGFEKQLSSLQLKRLEYARKRLLEKNNNKI